MKYLLALSCLLFLSCSSKPQLYTAFCVAPGGTVTVYAASYSRVNGGLLKITSANAPAYILAAPQNCLFISE